MSSGTIVVRKKNEVHVAVVGSDSGIEAELQEAFTLEVPGARFMPMVRNGMWDGRLRLYNSRAKTLYAGLADDVKSFCESRDYEFVEEKSEAYGGPFDRDDVTEKQFAEWVSGIPLTTRGEPISPRPYQMESAYRALTGRRCLILSPTASGKSLVIYLMLRYFLETNPSGHALVVVPQTHLCEQLFTDFADYSSKDADFDSRSACGRIYGGSDESDRRVSIITWQSAVKMPPQWFKKFGMVIGDEAHGFKAKSLCTIMERLTECRYRIGTTGTLDGTQTNEMVLRGLFGPVYRATTTRELIDAGSISDLAVEVLQLEYPDALKKSSTKLDYPQEIDLLVGHEARNRLVANLAVDQGSKNVLVLFNFVEKHLVPIYESIKRKLEGTGRNAYLVHGGIPADERERIRSAVEKEKGSVICANVQVFSTGVNLRNLHVIVFASPFKSQIRLLQSIGRGLRKSDDGSKTTVYDLADDLSWKKHKNFALSHARERIAIYSRERFDFRIHRVKMPS